MQHIDMKSIRQLADGAGRVEIGVQLGLAESGQRLVDAFLEDIGDGGKAAVQGKPRGLHLGVVETAVARIADGAVSGRHDLCRRLASADS